MDSNQNLGYLLNKAAKMAKWNLNCRLADEGITTPQWGLINDIYVNEKLCQNEEDKLCRLTPAAIAQRLHADRPTVSCMIDRLVKQNLAYRVSNPKDRRSQIILLTDRVKAMMPNLEQLSQETIECAVKGFEPEEIVLLRNLLTRIISNLDFKEQG